MRVLKIEPGKEAIVINIENSLEALQEQVGGYIEAVTIASDVVLIVDEEGWLKGKPHNFTFYGLDFTFYGLDFAGAVLAVGVDGEELCDLTAEAAEFLTEIIGVKRRREKYEAQ